MKALATLSSRLPLAMLLAAAVLAWSMPAAAQYSPYSYTGRQEAKLQVATFNLAQLSPVPDNIEQTRSMASNIVTVVKTVLYAQGGESAASAQGRRLWYDPSTLQLTITDYPANLRTVSDYLRSLPGPTGTTGRARSVIIPLKHQDASTVQDTLARITGIAPGSAAGAGGQIVTKTVSVGGELTFRDLRLRVLRIEPGANPQLRGDGQVTMVVSTSTQQSQDRTIQSYHSEFVDDYEINVLDVRPSGNGQGSARIEVRYNPAATGTAVVPVPGTVPVR